MTLIATSLEATIISLAGALIFILLGIVGYLIKDKQKTMSDKETGLTIATENLTKAVGTLEKTVVRIESGISSQNEFCTLRHQLIDERIKNLQLTSKA